MRRSETAPAAAIIAVAPNATTLTDRIASIMNIIPPMNLVMIDPNMALAIILSAALTTDRITNAMNTVPTMSSITGTMDMARTTAIQDTVLLQRNCRTDWRRAISAN